MTLLWGKEAYFRHGLTRCVSISEGSPNPTYICFLVLSFGNKGPSQRELHFLHAEVKALQDTLGISYKDAAHRMFLAEVERVQKADSASKAFAAIRTRIDNLVSHEICSPISAIDKGELDNYVLRNGRWELKSGGGGIGNIIRNQ
jgi:hypothetical protein